MDNEFLQLLHFFAEVLSKAHKISEQLQDPNLDLAKAYQLIFTLKTELKCRINAGDMYSNSGVINCNEEFEKCEKLQCKH